MALARNAHPKTAMTTAACAASRAAFVIAFPSSSRQEVENAGQDQKGAKGPTRLPVHYARLFQIRDEVFDVGCLDFGQGMIAKSIHGFSR
jgi:hypothetical protein